MLIDTNEIVIWGAGRIGRGFVADLYSQAGYHITFVDANNNLTSQLKKKRRYLLLHKYSDGTEKRTVIENFTALHTGETKKISCVMRRVKLMAVSVFPQQFEDVARTLAQMINERRKDGIYAPLNILLCTNLFEASKIMDDAVRSFLEEKSLPYYAEYVGISQCIVIRMAVPPSEQELAEDELVVVTNGYTELIADGSLWKGELPGVEGIRIIKDIGAMEARKLFTYNMLHALYAYIGWRKGLRTVYDCTRNREVQEIAEDALDEILQAVKAKYGADDQDIFNWRKNVLENMANPSLHDELERVGADPVRKLARNDRLTGAALLCLQNGVQPRNLARAIAAGILYWNEKDEKSLEIAKYLVEAGIRKTVEKYCGLENDPELARMISDECQNIRSNQLPVLQE